MLLVLEAVVHKVLVLAKVHLFAKPSFLEACLMQEGNRKSSTKLLALNQPSYKSSHEVGDDLLKHLRAQILPEVSTLTSSVP